MRTCPCRVVSLILRLFIGVLFPFCLINSPACLCRQATAEWQIETVDIPGGFDSYTSLAFDKDGKPAIAYYDAFGGGFLKYAHFNGASWDITPVDDTGDVGQYSSLVFDASGNPAISYYDFDNGDLKYAQDANGDGDFSDPDEIMTVDPADEDAGEYTSIAFHPLSGRPAISYYDFDNGNLKFARFDGTKWIIKNVDSTIDDVGEYTSIAFNKKDNKPSISYYDLDNGNLKYASFISGNSWNKTIVDSSGNVGEQRTSLAFDKNGKPSISYYGGGDLKYAHDTNGDGDFTDPDEIITVDSEGDVGQYNSLAFDASDNPSISYYDASNGDLKYAHFNGTTWDIETVDSEGDVGSDTSLALDASNNPAISYLDVINGGLKYARFVSATPTTTTTSTTTTTTTTTTRTTTTTTSTTTTRTTTSTSTRTTTTTTTTTRTTTTTTTSTTRTTTSTTTTTVPGSTTTTTSTTTTRAPTTTTTTTTTSTTTTTLVCQCPDDSIPPTGCISGRVTEIGTGEPIERKVVKLRMVSPRRPIVRKRVVTNSDGCYHLSDLKDGRYKIWVKRCKGGSPQIVEITGGGKVDANFECKKKRRRK